MDVACIREQGQAGETSRERCSSSREETAYLSTTHFSVITLQQKHTENVTANSVPFQKKARDAA